MSSEPKTISGEDLNLISIMQRFSTEAQARALLESIRWPGGVACPHCGTCDTATKIASNTATKVRPGLYHCPDCDKQFTVTVGTIFEDSHIPLNKWLIAFYMMCASKTQVSALQLQRQLQLGSYRTAWFMCHRIRFALAEHPDPTDKLKGTVEADETYIGGKVRGRGRAYVGNKTAVVSLIERKGRVRSRVVDMVTGESITKLLKEHVDENAHLNTDESAVYTKVGKGFASHETVNHSVEEYARTADNGERVTTNAAEGFFGNSKRSIDGTHHNISRKHTALYFSELDNKYNTRKVTDGERTVIGIRRIEGKRLMLKDPVAMLRASR
jgi:transposase-like protein